MIANPNATADLARAILPTAAARDVLIERRRQITVEGHSLSHDDVHDGGEMAGAAACYAMHGLMIEQDALREKVQRLVRELWPWADRLWKPKDRRHDLIKAAALLLAEIERLDRITERGT